RPVGLRPRRRHVRRRRWGWRLGLVERRNPCRRTRLLRERWNGPDHFPEWGMAVTGRVTADGEGDGIGGTVSLDATGGPLILGENAALSADGDGGAITIDTLGTVTVERSARVTATGPGQSGASGGTIDVTADTV